MTKLSPVVQSWLANSDSASADGIEGEDAIVREALTERTYNAPPARRANVRFRIFDDAEAERWEPPVQIVDGMLAKGSTAALYGMPATGKTTLALSLATALATGTQFLGRDTIQGSVLYIASEGQGGFGRRVAAAKALAGAKGRIGIYIISENVALVPEHDELIRSINDQLEQMPSLIVIDTLARAMVGLKENDQGDMGLVIQAVDAIRDATGAAVLLIHHTTKDGGAERGSGALRGALDTMMKVERFSNGTLLLSSEKDRDLPPFASVPFRIVEVEGGPVVRLVSSADVKPTPAVGKTVTARRRAALDALQVLGGTRVRNADWKRTANMADSTFNNVAGKLVEAGFVAKQQEGAAVYYSLLAKGRDMLAG